MLTCRARWGVALPVALRLRVAFALGVALTLRVPVVISALVCRGLRRRRWVRGASGSQKHQQKRAHNQRSLHFDSPL
jgi:uncharacterized membrane protein